jgi:hypothetical protein
LSSEIGRLEASTSRQTELPDLAVVYFGSRWKNADPDGKAINVLIRRGRYVAATAGAGGGHQRRGHILVLDDAGDLVLDDAGDDPRSRRLRS